MIVSLGRIVHFCEDAREGQDGLLAAIVSRVNPDGTVNLQVFGDGDADRWITDVKEGTEAGTWRWPERV